MGLRRQARESAVQALYMCDFLANWELEALEFCFDHFELPSTSRKFAIELCCGVSQNLMKIDSLITSSSEHWSIGRMGRVDRAILRMATYELMLHKDIPVNIIINEAIEVAKRYGSDDSPVFINGVLDKVASLLKRDFEIEKINLSKNEKLANLLVSEGEDLDLQTEDF